jgi:hypothetical protein
LIEMVGVVSGQPAVAPTEAFTIGRGLSDSDWAGEQAPQTKVGFAPMREEFWGRSIIPIARVRTIDPCRVPVPLTGPIPLGALAHPLFCYACDRILLYRIARSGIIAAFAAYNFDLTAAHYDDHRIWRRRIDL